MLPTAPEEIAKKMICHDCVGEAYLKGEIRRKGKLCLCSYCTETTTSMPLSDLADLFDVAFQDHYEQTPAEPDDYQVAIGMAEDWEREGSPAQIAIADSAQIGEEIAEDIRVLLADKYYDKDDYTTEAPFCEESHYAEKDTGHGEFLALWQEFESDLKTKNRYFSIGAKDILDQIFSGVKVARTIDGKSVVSSIKPGAGNASLYRARVFPGSTYEIEDALKKPWQELGPPPSQSAAPGRMNASGISVFYGAFDRETALAEVRPPVGSTVVIARFDVQREIRILDLDALRSIKTEGSIFDPDTLKAMQRARFLQILSHSLSRAILPHEETMAYLPTQVVADYLASEVGLDGIIFPSVQAGDRSSNIVIFNHASRVETPKIPKNVNIHITWDDYDDGERYPFYSISWLSPPGSKSTSTGEPAFKRSHHGNAATLCINLHDLTIHEVKSVRYNHEAHSVHFYS